MQRLRLQPRQSGSIEAARPSAAAQPRISNRMRDALFGYLFISPQVIGFLILVLVPLIAVFYYGFRNQSLLTGTSDFAGFDNYVYMFERDALFGKVIVNSLVFMLGTVVFNVILSLVLAVMLMQLGRARTLYRVLFFAPVVTSGAAWAIVWRFILQGEQGTLNQFLATIGIDGPNWLYDANWAMLSVIVTRVIKNAGLNIVIFTAALAMIPHDYAEAAHVDGANNRQVFTRITLPLLMPTILVVVILTMIGSMKVFDHIVLMTRGGPANATMVLIYYIYYQGFQFFETGYASALAVILFLISLVLTLVQWLSRKVFVYNEQ
ncbi:MAG: sugar ABC transporter permease [Chloroflexi bacterium]|uniref:carbohydrate ABC transporter permease n=1 Tax=Candidatus Flexifilum breve TaxID=3140694 RepID=UPI0031369DF2|nr:sugar ABC transporter permease [Chloroflexota bacterium]